MRIKIEAEGYRFTIPLPIGIMMNGFTSRMIESCIKKYANVPFTKEQLFILIRELKQAKKMFPNLPLVDVKTTDKQRVLITL